MNFYLAVTYDVCEHNSLFEDMNGYVLDNNADLETQVAKYAKRDIAPVVKVYESETADFDDIRLHSTFTFAEYECNCEE